MTTSSEKSKMAIAEDIKKLESFKQKLMGNDLIWANRMISAWRSYKRLSQQQQVVVDKLIAKASGEIESTAGIEGWAGSAVEPQAVCESGIKIDGIQALFAKAKKNHIQRPSLKMKTSDLKNVTVFAAKPESKNPGSIYIQIGDEYYGKINPSGNLILGPRQYVCLEVNDMIRAVAENPTAAGRVHGHKWNWCMFCGRPLTTKDSVYYGYGPICAEKWELEWGSAVQRIAEDREEETNQVVEDVFSQMVSKHFGGL